MPTGLQLNTLDGIGTINGVVAEAAHRHPDPSEIGEALSQVPVVKSPLLILALAMSVGLALLHSVQSKPVFIITIVIGVSLTAFAIGLIIRRRIALVSGILVAAFLCAGAALSLVESKTPEPDRISRMLDAEVIASAEPVEITGLVQGQPEPAPGSFYLTLQTESIRIKETEREARGTVLLLAHVNEQVRNDYDVMELRHGARVRVVTTLDRDEEFRNPGVFPLTEYLERKGYDATGVVKSPLLIERLDDERVFLPLAWLYEWRQHLETEFASRFSPETAGVLDAALLGNRYNISRGAAERFRAGGTFHVLVISGLQIAFIGGLVILLTRRLTRRKLLQFLIAATFMWSYAIAVGADPSVARAALMFTLVVLAIVLIALPVLQRMQRVGSWRPARETPYPPACSAWFRVLSESLFWSERQWLTEMAASNISYRLFKTPVAARLERWRLQRLIRFAFTAVVVSVSVQLGLLPMMLIYFHRLSIASLALNIFVGILMAALAFVALAAVMISHLSVLLAGPFIFLAEKINWLMIHLVDPFTRFSIASVRLPHYSGWSAGLYVLFYVLLGFLILGLTSWNPLRPVFVSGPALVPARTMRVAGLAFAVVLTVTVLHPLSARRPDGKLHVDFLDVGQGDSALVTMPDGTTLLVDGGGKPKINQAGIDESDPLFERDTRSIGEGVVSQYLWSLGLDGVDYVLATHADADHIDGLCDVARNFRVRGAMVARTPADDAEYLRFAATMRETGVPVEKLGAGDVLRFGDVSAQVLWPPPGVDENELSRNNDSIVLLIRYGEKKLLLTGDIEKEGEAAVLREGMDLSSDLVKVAHHGSKTSSIQAFVAAAHPSKAIISVGRTSMFGHPNKDVVERWRAAGAEVMTTGQRGTISVVTDGRELKVTTFVR